VSDWVPPVLVGTATAATGSFAAPGPTVTYSSTAGNMLVAVGQIANGSGQSGPALSATSGLTGITDTAGNHWMFSPVNSQNPPSTFNAASPGLVTFIAWCINAAAVTSVSFADAPLGTDVWDVCLSEWAGAVNPDWGLAAAAAGGSTFPGGSRVSTSQDLVIAGLFTTGTVATTPPGSAALQAASGVSVVYEIAPSFQPGVFFFIGSSNFSTSGTSLTPTVPACTAPGDLLVYDVTAFSATVSSWPAGFTPQLSITGLTDSTNQRYIATKIADGTELSNLTATMSGSGSALALVYTLRGAASAVPLNTATATANGDTTTLAAASLTIASPGDATIYGYGGETSGHTGFTTLTLPGTLANAIQGLGSGVSAGIGWGVDVTAPGAGSANAALDTLDYGLDFPPLALGAGGLVRLPWTLVTGAAASIVSMSFGPAGVPAPVLPQMYSF
jgi:hypothetical protein